MYCVCQTRGVRKREQRTCGPLQSVYCPCLASTVQNDHQDRNLEENEKIINGSQKVLVGLLFGLGSSVHWPHYIESVFKVL